MRYGRPVAELIRRRFSCRTFLERPMAAHKRKLLADFAGASQVGPFGSRARFELVAATEQDRQALKGLGTYGFIRGATGFIVGAVEHSPKALEDFGYLMERIILFATDLGLGTCWLGGSFTRSSFAGKISARKGESVPAVAAVGTIAEQPCLVERMVCRSARSDVRLAWERVFFQETFGQPISEQDAGPYATPLEMVRLGPSASNKQPWRIVHAGNRWHFFLQRTAGYQRLLRLARTADLQRVDMGIAMCHFALTADELGLPGEWIVDPPAILPPDDMTEYTATWVGLRNEGRRQDGPAAGEPVHAQREPATGVEGQVSGGTERAALPCRQDPAGTNR